MLPDGTRRREAPDKHQPTRGDGGRRLDVRGGDGISWSPGRGGNGVVLCDA